MPRMTPRERFLNALDRGEPSGRVPHFELVFYLTMEAFARVHPCHQAFSQWDQMSKSERALHRRNIAETHLAVAERFEHSAIYFLGPVGWGERRVDEHVATIEILKDIAPQDYCILVPGDPTYSIPNGENMIEFSARMIERPQEMKDHAQRQTDAAVERARAYKASGVVDGFCMCADYCFNDMPFFSPAMFDDFIVPYLTESIAAYREMGLYAIKHTDGNIMPILDQLVTARPHALHSIDPQGGVDIAEVKRLVGDKVCLIGNVSCAMLDTGTDEECIESARYALQSGMPGGGYVFSTSNCIYTGMALDRYELILDVWRREGNYD